MESGIYERGRNTTLRDLTAALILGRRLGVDVKTDGFKRVRLWIDNQGGRFVIAKTTSKYKSMVFELRVLKLLTRIRITPSPHWHPFADNFFADRLSRTWDPDVNQVHRLVRRPMMRIYAHLGVASNGAWAYLPFRVHPVMMQKVTLAALKDWRGPRARDCIAHQLTLSF